MAGLASAVFALIILLPSSSAIAGDLFTGFQMDNEAQYFAYLGAREDLPWKSFGLQGYAQLFAAGQSSLAQWSAVGLDCEMNVRILFAASSVSVGRWTSSPSASNKWAASGYTTKVMSPFSI